MSILSVLFFIPFCRFRGNNRFGGECFPTEEVVIVFFVLCHINCMEILTTIIYLFHIKTDVDFVGITALEASERVSGHLLLKITPKIPDII